MTLLAVCGGVLLGLALIVREVQLNRERTTQAAAFEQMRLALETSRKQVRRAREDLFVIRAVLEEKNVISEAELARGRIQLIENPRRIAKERDRIVRGGEVAPNQVIIDDSETIH